MNKEIENTFSIEEVQNKLKELRKKRNEYASLSQNIQKEIDKLIDENCGIDTEKYKNQFFEYRDGESLYYGKISYVDRLYRGIRVMASRVLVYTSDIDLHFYNNAYVINIDFKNIDSFKVIEPSVYQKEIERMKKVII